ncbi:MAG TPA: indole-3-glycerol phosphate synthase TrpC [Longimicrobiales bacterium]|nr:indole-3-glycerol phosphate synthase TrpC [Longimicrobiales bacterium]
MSVLDEIVRAKRAEVGRLHPWRSALRKQAESAPAPRDFTAALRGDAVGVVAEVKRRSPSAGWIRRDLNAAGLASMYAHGGASAVSVLTDGQHFGGSREDLEQVRGAVAVPVLRKDFVLEPVQVHEARAMGADAVLLIVRILNDAALRDLVALAGELAMAALVETHEVGEVERALKAGARVLGINNRDLSRFETDLGTTERLIAGVPGDVVVVGESGVRDRADVERLAEAGADAVLVGESLVRSDDPQAAVAALAGVPRRPREAA